MILKELTIRNLIVTLDSFFSDKTQMEYKHDKYTIICSGARASADHIEKDIYLSFHNSNDRSSIMTLIGTPKIGYKQICDVVKKHKEELLRFGFIDDLQDAEPQKLINEAKELLLKESIAPKDNVNHPSHYNQGKIECIEAIESATIGKSGIEAVCVANVIKYLWRYEQKGGKESVEKAKWYLEKLLEKLEEK